MKSGIVVCLFVAVTTCLHAQDSLVAAEDVWVVNEWGNLIALRNSNEYELARYLNTSSRIGRWLLEQQGYKHDPGDTITLAKGDSLAIDYGLHLIPGTLSGIGKFICDQLDNNLDKYLFSNYWTGNGDVELSSTQFAGILVCLRHNQNAFLPDTVSQDTCNSATPCVVSFYNTHYGQSFGSATVYVNTDNQIVGFSDLYDFDSKKWGLRPAQYEFYVRFVSLFSPRSASSFRVYFVDGIQ